MKLGTMFTALTAAASMLAWHSAGAHEVVYTANLLGLSESPPVATTGNGVGMVTVDFDLVTMRVQMSFADLLGQTTAAHIHCCTTDPFSGNVGVATQLPSFTGFPLGISAGTYDQTFDMSLASSYNPAFITANGGTVSTAFSALAAGLDSGRGYLNIHTSFAPGGEIRALLAPVPEPETWAMLAAGLAMLAPAMRRSQRQPT